MRGLLGADVIPDFITHYSRGRPFRSLTSQTPAERLSVIATLDPSNAWGLGRFKDPEYLPRRLAAEQKLRNAFIARGGRPLLSHPIYFFLGRNSEFEKVAANVAHTLSLASLTREEVSFTLGDSLLALDDDYRSHSGALYSNVHCGKVFLKDELSEIASGPLHIEAQVWIDPLKKT